MNFGLPASKLVDTTAFEAKAPITSTSWKLWKLPFLIHEPQWFCVPDHVPEECESHWAGAITPEEFETRVDEQAAESLTNNWLTGTTRKERAAICALFKGRAYDRKTPA